jgi:hypothetical protein
MSSGINFRPESSESGDILPENLPSGTLQDATGNINDDRKKKHGFSTSSFRGDKARATLGNNRGANNTTVQGSLDARQIESDALTQDLEDSGVGNLRSRKLKGVSLRQSLLRNVPERDCYHVSRKCSLRRYPMFNEDYWKSDCRVLGGQTRLCCPDTLKNVPWADMATINDAVKSGSMVPPVMGRQVDSNDTSKLEICPKSVTRVCDDSVNPNACIVQKCRENGYDRLFDTYEVCKTSQQQPGGPPDKLLEKIPDCSPTCDLISAQSGELVTGYAGDDLPIGYGGNNGSWTPLSSDDYDNEVTGTAGNAAVGIGYLVVMIIGMILFCVLLVSFIGFLAKKRNSPYNFRR